MNALVNQLLRQSLTGGWMILALVVLRPLIKKLPRWISCLLWALAAIRLAIPFSLESRMSLVPQTIAAPTRLTPITPLTAQISMTELPVQAAAPAAQESISFQALLPALWLIGVAAMTVYALISCIRLLRRVQVSIRIGKRLYLSDEVKSPFILGIFRPRIYLPSELKQPTADFVLAHEQTHLRRGDHLWKPLGYALLSIFWFNPLCWLGYILFCRDIEQACDEAVIRDMSPSAKKAYSTALLPCSLPGHAVAACPLAFGEVGVKQRIQGILSYRKPKFWVLLLSAVLCTVLAVGFLTNPADASQAEAATPDSQEATLNTIPDEMEPTVFIGKEEQHSFTQQTAILSAPSSGSREVAQANAGESYYLIRREPIAGNVWGYIECQDGTVMGWILLEEAEAEPEPLHLGIQVHSSPSADGRILCELTPGEDYTILERTAIGNQIWAYVECKEGTTKGWIMLMAGSESDTFLSGIVTADRVNVRSGPGTLYSAVGYLEAGMEVIILEVVSQENQQWGNIGGNSWVNMEYIDCQQAEEPAPEATLHTYPSETETETITFREPTDVYSSPSAQSRLVGKTETNEACTILRREFIADGSWAYLFCPSGNFQGWVHLTEEDEALNYFREYVAAYGQPEPDEVEKHLYFSSEYAREFFLDNYAPITGWYPSGIFRVNDDLWGIQFADSNSDRMVYSFVGRMEDRLYVFQNVHQVPEALSENLDVKAYEEENAMYLSDEYMECSSVIKRLLPFADPTYVAVEDKGTKDYSNSAPCPIEDVICGTDTWRVVPEPSSYGSPSCVITLTARDGSVATICDSSPVILVSHPDGTQQWFQSWASGEELVGMLYSWAKSIQWAPGQ